MPALRNEGAARARCSGCCPESAISCPHRASDKSRSLGRFGMTRVGGCRDGAQPAAAGAPTLGRSLSGHAGASSPHGSTSGAPHLLPARLGNAWPHPATATRDSCLHGIARHTSRAHHSLIPISCTPAATHRSSPRFHSSSYCSRSCCVALRARTSWLCGEVGGAWHRGGGRWRGSGSLCPGGEARRRRRRRAGG
jgi:hypothetical protein